MSKHYHALLGTFESPEQLSWLIYPCLLVSNSPKVAEALHHQGENSETLSKSLIGACGTTLINSTSSSGALMTNTP